MSALKMCPTCGAEYPANERFCPRDGTALRAQGGTAGDLVGSIIAERYHVMKKLGEGGMGQVYLAEHVKMGRKSAVKVMNPGMVQDADAISRFNREAANASRINHPNVAGIYDFGETPDGLIYLAMEFIEGEALTDLVKSNGALAPLRAANITRQAAEGLQVAHDLGIVHRDLKPDNIMIAKNRDGTDCVKVVDFGIAKAAGAENQKVTRTGLVVGTPEYMSPEQLAGDRLDAKSDIYSLALVTFNMLTGKLPFPSETVQESMIMRLTDKPRALVEMNPMQSWSPEVQRVMDRALERDAKLRYQSASEFGQELYRAIEGMPKSEVAEGGTLVMAPVPPTRVGGIAATPEGGAKVAPSGGAPPAVRGKSRLPLYVGGGAVAAAIVAGVILMRPSTPPAVAANSSPVVTPNTAPSGPITTTSAPGQAPAATPTSGEARPAGSQKAVGGGREAVGARTPASSKTNGGAAADVATRLPALLDQSDAESSAPAALAAADSLLPRATRTSDLVGLGLVRAKALGMLSRDAESCSTLRSIQGRADGTPYAARIAQLLRDGC